MTFAPCITETVRDKSGGKETITMNESRKIRPVSVDCLQGEIVPTRGRAETTMQGVNYYYAIYYKGLFKRFKDETINRHETRLMTALDKRAASL